MKSGAPTKRQAFLLAHIGKGTCKVVSAGHSYEHWTIIMQGDYMATSTRQPSIKEGAALITRGWVDLIEDKAHYSQSNGGARTYHHRARLTDAGQQALKGIA